MPPTVVQSLLVEMDGRTAKLDAALERSRGNVRNFGKTAADAGATGTALGHKYERAAYGIASATESMARMGSVSGGALKQVLRGAAELGLVFGVGGPLVAAVGVTALAIASAFSRARSEMEETRKKFQDELKTMVNAADAAGLMKKAAELYRGTPGDIDEKTGKAAPFSSGIQASNARIADFESRRNAMTSVFVDALIKKELKRTKELREEFERVRAAILATNNTPLEIPGLAKITITAKDARTELAALRRATLDNAELSIEQQVKSWEDGLSRQADAIKARDKAAQESAEMTARLTDELAVEMAKQTKTLVDDIQLKFQKFLDDAAANGDWALVRKFTAARDEAIALQRTIEDLDAAARELGLDFKDVANANVGSIAPEQFAKIADAIERSARGAIQLAEAFGLVSATTSKSLQAIAQIAASLPALKAASSAGQWGGAGGIIASALPVVGGIAAVADAFISAGKAAREHAKALQEASRKLIESLEARIGGIGLTDAQSRTRDVEQQRIDDLNAMLDILIQSRGIKIGTREAFLDKTPADQRKVLTDALAKERAKFPAGFETSLTRALEAAIKEFDLIAEAARKAAEALAEEQAAKRVAFDQSLEERRLRLAGDEAAADAAALLAQHEAELAAYRKEGIYTAEQLAALEQIQVGERQKAAAAAQKRREDEDRAKAQTAARRKEDLQTRINAADGESAEERALRVAIEHRRELEDAMAEGADEVTLNLIKLAQAAGDAAAAQAALTAAQRDMEDLDVRLLRAQGKGGDADRLEFTNRQRRDLEDAIAAGKDEAYLAKLRTTQAEELKAFLAGLVESAGEEAPTIAAARAGGRSVASAAVQNITITQADRLVSMTGTLVAYAGEELAVVRAMLVAIQNRTGGALVPPALASSVTVGAGGQVIQVRVTIANNFYGNIEGGTAGAENLSAEMLRAINAGLGAEVIRGLLGRGDASR